MATSAATRFGARRMTPDMHRPEVPRRLNPHAPVFVPQSFISYHITKFSHVGALGRVCGLVDYCAANHELFDSLPDEVKFHT